MPRTPMYFGYRRGTQQLTLILDRRHPMSAAPTQINLYHLDDARPVEIGDAVTSFRGEPFIVRGWEVPRNLRSTGRVLVEDPFDPAGVIHFYYPSVFNLGWDS